MNTYTISATELKKNTSEVLNKVFYEKVTAIVERHGKPFAKIIPADRTQTAENIDKLLKKYYGIWKNEPWAKDIGRKSRYFRKRKPLFP